MNNKTIIRFEGVDGDEFKESSIINTTEWLGYLGRCPGITDVTNMGYLYILNQDIEFTYKNSKYGVNYKKDEANFTVNTLFEYCEENEDNSDRLKNNSKRGDLFSTFFDDDYEGAIYKFNLEWMVVTSPGISSLIVEPFYRRNASYNICPGLLNSDKLTENGEYTSNNQLNPFVVWRRENEENIVIPSGTPLFQIIPYKRDLI